MRGRKGFYIVAIMLTLLLSANVLVKVSALEASGNQRNVSENGSITNDGFAAEHAQIDNLEEQYKSLQEQQKAIQSKINSAKSEKEKQLSIKQQIGTQIDNTTAQIDLLIERIALLESVIVQKEEELEQKNIEINENYELFKKRLCAMTRVPTGNTLSMVLGASTYSQFVNRTKITTRIVQHDRDLIAELNGQRESIERVKEEIESSKREVEGDKASLQEKKTELNHQMEETQQHIHDISLLEQQFLANKAAMQKQMEQVQAEIAAIYAEIAARFSNQVYVGGSMDQPTPTLNQITSRYGWRFNGSDFHTGIDFSGSNAYGAKVIAANTGTVAKVNHSYTPGYGYGKYIIIDHGGGITTLYAHLSEIYVSEGTAVGRGETIGAVGSTGWSTGPHLHFEVREGVNHVDPEKYL